MIVVIVMCVAVVAPTSLSTEFDERVPPQRERPR
jgi:hypothetical protein